MHTCFLLFINMIFIILFLTSCFRPFSDSVEGCEFHPQPYYMSWRPSFSPVLWNWVYVRGFGRGRAASF